MVAQIMTDITAWVTGFIGAIVGGLEAFVDVFYDGTALTPLGSLALMGLGIGLVTLAIGFVTRLFKK